MIGDSWSRRHVVHEHNNGRILLRQKAHVGGCAWTSTAVIHKQGASKVGDEPAKRILRNIRISEPLRSSEGHYRNDAAVQRPHRLRTEDTLAAGSRIVAELEHCPARQISDGASNTTRRIGSRGQFVQWSPRVAARCAGMFNCTIAGSRAIGICGAGGKPQSLKQPAGKKVGPVLSGRARDQLSSNGIENIVIDEAVAESRFERQVAQCAQHLFVARVAIGPSK